ncbi:hypothetical protein MKX01_029468 [Papaver californicum]|nr:hypothetical protein MKX01_029468 [Papaver californicum]
MESEESKDQNTDEGVAPVEDFGVTESGGAGMISNDQWGGDAQWAGDTVAAPSLAPSANWTDTGIFRYNLVYILIILLIVFLPVGSGVMKALGDITNSKKLSLDQESNKNNPNTLKMISI